MIGAAEVHTNDELIHSELVTVDLNPGAFEPLANRTWSEDCWCKLNNQILTLLNLVVSIRTNHRKQSIQRSFLMLVTGGEVSKLWSCDGHRCPLLVFSLIRASALL